MNEYYPIEVQVLRGNFVESRHHVAAVVVDDDGDIVESHGPQEILVSPRSAIKMLQAISFVESGAVEKFALSAKHIAFSCSSHVGEPGHLKLVHEWRNQLGLSIEAFVCGAHYPTHEPSAHAMIRLNQKPTSEHNNCSGKHLGILSTCLTLGFTTENYGKPSHPLQQRFRLLLSELTGVDHDKASWGIDGCGIPTWAIPLKSIAQGMSMMIRPGPHALAAKKIISSIQQEPFYIAGSQEFATQLCQATQGRILVKIGAEGVYCGFIESLGRAFSFKALDGATRAAESALCFWLKKNNYLMPDEMKTLNSYFEREIKNWRGEVVGAIRAN